MLYLKLHLNNPITKFSNINIETIGKIVLEDEDKSLFSDKYNKITIRYEEGQENILCEDVIRIYKLDKLRKFIKSYQTSNIVKYLIERLVKSDSFYFEEEKENFKIFYNIRFLYKISIYKEWIRMDDKTISIEKFLLLLEKTELQDNYDYLNKLTNKKIKEDDSVDFESLNFDNIKNN